MTDDRRKELLDSALFWITSHIHDDDEIYNSLHNVIGMTDFEIVDCGIDYLCEYFTDRPDKSILFSKVTLTADNGSTDEFLGGGIVNCEVDLQNDNPELFTPVPDNRLNTGKTLIKMKNGLSPKRGSPQGMEKGLQIWYNVVTTQTINQRREVPWLL